jgi:leader peptidase (prepilin peptidase) / N-methyltransferase
VNDVLEQVVHHPVWLGFSFVLGALLGSFANVCIYRIPHKKSIVTPGSHCGQCGKPVRFYDNIPILSWIILRGRCRHCGTAFSPRYLFVEAATGMLVTALWFVCIEVMRPEDSVGRRLARFGVYTLFTLALVVITFIDLDHKKIPDVITYPAIPLFFLLGIALRDRTILDTAIGLAAGYLIVRLISDGYYYLTGREGMGYGDGKLLAVIGALLGWKAVLFSLFGGSLIGSVIGTAAIVYARRKPRPETGDTEDSEDTDEPPLRHVEIPFGPFLVAGALVYLFLQDSITVALARIY